MFSAKKIMAMQVICISTKQGWGGMGRCIIFSFSFQKCVKKQRECLKVAANGS